MNINKETYKEMLVEKRNYKNYSINALQAFISGGITCLFGQIMLFIYVNELNYTFKQGVSLMIITLVFIASILSALGIYDKLGQVGKCGLIVPITGFANAVVSSALEYKPEGFILGINSNTFKLAGSVISLGIFFAYVVALIRYLFWVII